MWKSVNTLAVVSLLAIVASGCSGQGKALSNASVRNCEGNVGVASQKVISGWAWDKANPDSAISVDIFDGATLLGTVVADRLRDDLVRAGKGNGKHGFVFQTPAAIRDGKEHLIIVRVTGTDCSLEPKKGMPLAGPAK